MSIAHGDVQQSTSGNHSPVRCPTAEAVDRHSGHDAGRSPGDPGLGGKTTDQQWLSWTQFQDSGLMPNKRNTEE